MARRVLIIDDDTDICESANELLTSMGYDVLITHDGRTGLALMALEDKRSPIEGVFLDVSMPIMDGMEVLRKIRSRHPSTPVVLMMSTDPTRHVLREAVSAGANSYLTKPLNVGSLTHLCERFFPLHSQR